MQAVEIQNIKFCVFGYYLPKNEIYFLGVIVEIQELKALIKETMREVLQEERLRLCQILIPYISDDEQREIETEFGLPSSDDDNEVFDMTDWVKYGNQISQESD